MWFTLNEIWATFICRFIARWDAWGKYNKYDVSNTGKRGV